MRSLSLAVLSTAVTAFGGFSGNPYYGSHETKPVYADVSPDFS